MAYGLSDSKRWIVVFDLDDTLVTGYENGETNIIQDNFFLLQKAVQQRLEGPNKTVQYIFLYTYNTNDAYVSKAIKALDKKLTDSKTNDLSRILFDTVNMGSSFTNTGRSNIAVNALSKQITTIQRMYDDIKERNKPSGPINKRVIFIDNKIHNDLLDSIGDNYAHVPFREEDIPKYEEILGSNSLNTSLNVMPLQKSRKSLNKYKNRKPYDKVEWIRINEVEKIVNKLKKLPEVGPRSSLSIMSKGGRLTRRRQKKSKFRKTRTKN
jgi:hypothetical protein